MSLDALFNPQSMHLSEVVQHGGNWSLLVWNTMIYITNCIVVSCLLSLIGITLVLGNIAVSSLVISIDETTTMSFYSHIHISANCFSSKAHSQNILLLDLSTYILLPRSVKYLTTTKMYRSNGKRRRAVAVEWYRLKV